MALTYKSSNIAIWKFLANTSTELIFWQLKSRPTWNTPNLAIKFFFQGIKSDLITNSIFYQKRAPTNRVYAVTSYIRLCLEYVKNVYNWRSFGLKLENHLLTTTSISASKVLSANLTLFCFYQPIRNDVECSVSLTLKLQS